MSRCEGRRSIRTAAGAATAVVATVVATLAAGLPAAAVADHAEAAWSATAATRPDIVDPDLRSELSTLAAGEEVEYLVSVDAEPDLSAVTGVRDAVVAALKETAAASQQPVVETLKERGAEVLNTFWLGNLVLVRSEPGIITGLTASPLVDGVHGIDVLEVPEPEPEPEPDPAGARTASTVENRTWGLDRIGAHRVWGDLGLDGSGVRVAVLDTGVVQAHPDLAGKLATDDATDPAFPGGWMEWDANGHPVQGTPRDTQGHGTHVSGTVVGGAASGLHIGVAPGADLMHGLVLPGGSGTTPQIIAGMQWAVDPYDHEGEPAGEPADVVNMSFGPSSGGINEAFVGPIRDLAAAGVLPVASAGNCGAGCHGSPANIVEALAVGATDVNDDVAGFSGGGVVEASSWTDPPADWPARWTVPDVAAPGVDVVSSVRSSFGPPYGSMNGTSMAAPHVAGIAALMLSGNPGLTLAEIEDALVATSFFDERHGAQRPNTRFGHGRVDAFQAVSRVVLDSGVGGVVVDAGTDEPVGDVLVEVPEAGVAMRTGSDGRYEFRLPAGTYTVQASWAGRIVTSDTGVAVGDGVAAFDVTLGGLAGQVTDAGTRDPVEGVEVTVGTDVATSTDVDGDYRLYLGDGTYQVRWGAFGYDPTTLPTVTVAARAITTADARLTALPTGTIGGRVDFDESGLGIPGVAVELAGGQRSATTRPDGRFEITGVPVGEHTVVARPHLFDEPDPVQVAVTADRGTDVDFRLACGSDCEGLWVARHDGPQAAGYDSATDVAVSPDGSRAYVTGGEGTFAQRDYATIAYDTGTGRPLWTARYDGPAAGQDSATALELSPDGSRVYVTGASLGRPGGPAAVDYATVAYDAATGTRLWEARYNGPSDAFDNPAGLAVSADGSRVVVTGQSSVDGPPRHSDYATVAYDAATGAQLWVAAYDGPSGNFDAARDVVVTPDGAAVVVTGQSPGEGGQSSSQGSGWDYATVAYDTDSGDELWVSRYDGPTGALDQAASIAVSPDGSRLLVTGMSDGTGTGADYATVAYEPATGAELWAARYDGPGHGADQPATVTVSPTGDAAYVVGASRSGAGTDTADAATVAYDLVDGTQRWVARYDGPAQSTDTAVAAAVSPDGSRVVITGTSAGAGTGTDLATVAYDAADGIQRWAARYDGPAGDADDASAVAFSPDGARVLVTGSSDLGIGDDPAIAPRPTSRWPTTPTEAARHRSSSCTTCGWNARSPRPGTASGSVPG